MIVKTRNRIMDSENTDPFKAELMLKRLKIEKIVGLIQADEIFME